MEIFRNKRTNTNNAGNLLAVRFNVRYVLRLIAIASLLLILLTSCRSDDLGVDGDAASDGDTDLIVVTDGDADFEGSAGELEAAFCVNNLDCEDGFYCDQHTGDCTKRECSFDEQCVELLGENYFCNDYRCVLQECDTDSDCESDEYCDLGLCIRLPECGDIAGIALSNVNTLIRTGEERLVVASLVDSGGNTLPILFEIEWTSMNEDVVSVSQFDKKPGQAVVRGGLLAGSTTVLAKLVSISACSSFDLSATVSFENFTRIYDGLRIIVASKDTNDTVGGATVIVNGQTQITASDSGRGVVLFDNVEAPYDIHVFHPDYHYVSMIAMSRADNLVYLQPFHGINQSAGIKTTVDFSAIPSSLRKNITFGMTGMSFMSNFLSIDISKIFSSPLMSELPFNGPFHDLLPIPSNVILDITEPDEDIKILMEGESGSNVAWGMGGYMATDDLVEMVTSLLYSGWMDVGAFIFSGIYLTEDFYHGILPDIELVSAPKVPDNGEHLDPPFDSEDLNGNGSTDDYIPNYDQFIEQSDSLALIKPLDQKADITTGKLPTFSGGVDSLFVLVGSSIDNRQFIPLGVGAEAIIHDPLSMDLPKVNGGVLEVNYAQSYGPMDAGYTVIALAMAFSDQLNKAAQDSAYSAILQDFDEEFSEAELGDFLELVTYAIVDDEERYIRFIPSLGADMHRLSFSKQGRYWEVLVGGDPEPFSNVEVYLPVPPGDDPFGDKISITAVDLKNDITLDQLVEFNAISTIYIDRYMKRYSLYHFD